MKTGESIRAFRERMGLTQLQLAEIAGASDKAVSAWENGTREPRAAYIDRIAERFGVRKSAITDGDPTENGAAGINAELISMFAQLTPDEKRMFHAQLKGILATRK